VRHRLPPHEAGRRVGTAANVTGMYEPRRVAHRRLLTLLALSLCSLPIACGGVGTNGPTDGKKAMAHVQALVAIGPRPFGSPELAKAADYITGELTKLGLQPQRHELLHEKEKKTIRNLHVQIDGDDPVNGPILMLGAHYDTKLAAGHADAAHNIPFVGAIDGGGAPGVLLELARLLKERTPKPKCNVWLYWIDAEESIDWTWNDERALLGSKAFCEMLSKTKQLARVKAFVLLDLIGSKDMKIDNDGQSESRLQNLFLAAGKALGVADHIGQFPTPLEVAQIKDYLRRQGKPEKWGITDDHNTFTNFGVPSVLLIDFERRMPERPPVEPTKHLQQWWHTADDNLAAMDSDSLAFAGNLVMTALPQLEDFVLGIKKAK
jgi:Zn-dependent M28 family amino/carboxypeptidase